MSDHQCVVWMRSEEADDRLGLASTSFREPLPYRGWRSSGLTVGPFTTPRGNLGLRLRCQVPPTAGSAQVRAGRDLAAPRFELSLDSSERARSVSLRRIDALGAVGHQTELLHERCVVAHIYLHTETGLQGAVPRHTCRCDCREGYLCAARRRTGQPGLRHRQVMFRALRPVSTFADLPDPCDARTPPELPVRANARVCGLFVA